MVGEPISYQYVPCFIKLTLLITFCDAGFVHLFASVEGRHASLIGLRSSEPEPRNLFITKRG
jgi:hypothetical protein